MRKRVLFISNLFPNPASPQMATFNQQQIAALHEHCDVDVISPVSWISRLGDACQKTRRDAGGVTVYHPSYYYPPGCLRGSYGTFFYWSIRAVAAKLLSRHRYDCVFASWLYPDAWAAARIAREAGLPLYVKVHGTDVNRLASRGTMTLKSLDVVNAATRVVCVSQALKHRLVQLGASPDKLEVVYNGVDRTTFFPMSRLLARMQLSVPADDTVILFVGNLKKDKGLAELVEAFNIVSAEPGPAQWQLVIVGTGNFAPVIERLAGTSRHGVRMMGSLPLQEVALWMNAATLLCLPSYMEGVPNVVLEALACGTRVVATRVGGIPELDAGDGRLILIEPRSVNTLVSALKRGDFNTETPPNGSFPHSWQENAEQLMRIFACGG